MVSARFPDQDKTINRNWLLVLFPQIWQTIADQINKSHNRSRPANSYITKCEQIKTLAAQGRLPVVFHAQVLKVFGDIYPMCGPHQGLSV